MRRCGFTWIAMVAVLLASGPSDAVERCQAKVNAKTGAVEVGARNVEGNPVWSGTAGGVAQPFEDVSTCFAGDKLKKCHLGDPGTDAERTPPSGCEVHVRDDGPSACAARIRGCTPGVRTRFHTDDDDFAVQLSNSGSGQVVRAEVLDSANDSAAIFARTAGVGTAIDAEVNEATAADALFARTTSPIAGSYAGVFVGPVQINCSAAGCNTTNALQVIGILSATVKNFKIDHPLDPANKYLLHTSVESPDMKNLYDGIVTTDSNGFATIELPDWFAALNRDFRYQLTPIGTFAQAIVKDEIADNLFTIQTDRPGVKVSWQVTGIRHDAYAEAHRTKVEEDKPEAERGTFIEPTAAPTP
jgi:hypothetical protein